MAYDEKAAEAVNANPSFCAAIKDIAEKLFPKGFDTSNTPPDSMYELALHIARTGRMCVRKGDPGDPVDGFDSPETWEAFRAWHDWCHVQGNHPFDLEGECKAVAMQLSQLRLMYGMEQCRDWEAIIEQQIIKDNFGEMAVCPIHNYK